MYLVTGATGNTGSLVVSELNKQGIKPRVFVRNQYKAQTVLANNQYETAIGDFADKSSIEKALVGVKSVYLVTNENTGFLEQLDTFIRCAEAAKVERFIVLSALADVNSDVEFVRLHGQYEQRIQQSSLNYSIIYPDWFMQNFLFHLQRREFIFPGGDGKVSFIDIYDVASFAAALMTQPDLPEQQIYSITGPEAMSFSQAVDKFNQVLVPYNANKFVYTQLTPQEYVNLMVANGQHAQGAQYYADMTKFTRNGTNFMPTTDFERIVGRKPNSFEVFIDRYLNYVLQCLG